MYLLHHQICVYMKILITGGSGFIGTRLYKLLKDKFHTTIFDIHQPVESEANFILGSIHDEQKLSESIQGKDIVIHLAAAVGVKNTEDNPVTTLDTNIIGTKKILESCAKHKIKKIIFASSSSVAGLRDRRVDNPFSSGAPGHKIKRL